MSTKAGNCGTGNLHYGIDEMAVLRGVLASESDPKFYPDDYATEHDRADIPELKNAA